MKDNASQSHVRAAIVGNNVSFRRLVAMIATAGALVFVAWCCWLATKH